MSLLFRDKTKNLQVNGTLAFDQSAKQTDVSQQMDIWGCSQD